MMLAVIYKPELWRDFFVMVGGGAAALTGLVFVAMSLNLEAVTQDATHRNRAIAVLTGFSLAFILCGVALMGEQNNLTLGIEWLMLSAIGACVHIGGYIQAVTQGGSRRGSIWSGSLLIRHALWHKSWVLFCSSRVMRLDSM